jgi:DNA-binding transcriptional MerR regulator
MTIKEVEKLLEIPRATVRFYEKEGLINPTREENGYRDYCEEDVERLRKIIILRKIGLPIEEIVDLFDGVKSIEIVLAENSINLQKQMAELEGAINLCNKMKTEVVNLDSFDTEKYWNYVEEEERKGYRFADIAKDFMNEEKKIVSGYIGWTDREGNLYDVKKSIICWGISLVVIGIIFCVANHGFNIENFSKGVCTMLGIMCCEMIISIPVILLGKKFPWFAENRIKAFTITGGMLMVLLLGLLYIFG